MNETLYEDNSNGHFYKISELALKNAYELRNSSIKVHDLICLRNLDEMNGN